MLTKYIQTAMSLAKYEVIEDDNTYFGSIPGFQGLWANADTLEACRDELMETLEDWILVGVRRQMPLPVIGGIDLNVRAGV
jgi:predicted RNase H-like HicB family nuclease